ncbi:MAG: NTP transferase domain-containing protein, partial [Patulibacter sp.]
MEPQLIRRPAPRAARIGVVLAGGSSRRMPGGKAGAMLAGRTLLERAVATVAEAGLEPAVCGRAGVELPPTAARCWREPPPIADADRSPHPLRGVAWALRQAGEPAVVLPVDLPLLPAGVLAGLATAPHRLAVLGDAGRPAALVLRA